MKNKKTIIVLSILTIIFTIIGGSLAYYNWQTSESQKTNIVFTVEGNFSCAADGGGDITSSDVMLAPASCTNSKYAIKREVTVTPKILGNGLNIDMDLWLDIDDLGEGLSKSKNFKYALTTESDSCTEGVIAEGTFEGKTKEDKIDLLKEKTYNQTTSDKYYLYIWLDAAETSTDTMNQKFNFSLNGMCAEKVYNVALDIIGTNTYGQTLTAKISDNSNDNLYTYQWYSNSSNSTTGGSAISGATSSTYVLGADLVGKYIYVVATSSDGSRIYSDITDEITNTFATIKNIATIPTTASHCNSLIYTGSNQTLTKIAETGYTFSNNTRTAAGSQIVTAILDNDYVWSDYETGAKTFSCSIAKASCACTISETPTLIYPEMPTGNIIYSCGGDGTKSVVSEKTSVITVGIVGTTSTPLTALNSGTSKITVSQAAGTNYNACSSVSKEITVSGSAYNTYLIGTGGSISDGKILTNMAINGSFENGNNNWDFNNASITTTQKYTGNSSLQLNSGVTAMAMQTMNIPSPTLNHKYYGRTMFLSSNDFIVGDSRFEWYYSDDDDGKMIFSTKYDKTSSWITKSSIMSLNASNYLDNPWYIRNFTVNGSTTSYVDDVMIIDLTNSYGTGNELNDLNILNQIPFFENTEYIYSKTLTYGSTYGTLPSSSKTGYTFKGWYTEPDGGTQVTSSTTMTNSNDHMLYAQWSANELIFNNQSISTTFSTSSQTKTYTGASNGTGNYTYTITGTGASYFSVSGTTLTIAANTPAATYTLTVTAKDNGSGVTKSSTFTITIGKAACSCTITSIPTLKHPGTPTGNITYSCGGDGTRSIVSETTSVITVGTVGTTSTPLTALNSGTSKITVSQAAGTNYNSCTSASKDVSVSLTTYTVTYNANGGSGAPSAQTKTHGTDLTLSTTKPMRTNYVFLGWHTSSSATSAMYSAGGKYTSNASITLYAVWKKDMYIEKILNGTAPDLVTGMIPVTISNTGVVTTADTTTQWYSYENKQWANAVLVKKDATSGVTGSKSRQYYMENPGETVIESDILAYYVWIPRYKYTFPNANGSPELISIIFENKDTDKSIPSTGKASGTNYYTHPAFTFGTNNELNGIWVGKFETSHSTLSSSGSNDNLSCTSEACANADGLIIKPNVASLRRNSVSNMFYSSRFMSTTNNSFGLDGTTTNTHMLKNSEWGAIAYLSHSQYGKGNVEITINNNSNFITGAGNGTTYFSPVTGTYTHPQSTTGNITGVFDISGGAHEYVMGNYDKYNRNFETLPEEKYYDIYSTSTTSTASCTLAECGGHALHETSGWYSDYNSFVYYGYPWFARGGRFDAGSTAGAFNLDRGDGGANAYYGFRSVAIKEV